MGNSFQKHDISSREMTHRVRARSAVSENKTFLKPGFFFFFCVFPCGKKQTAAAANVQRRRSNRGYEVRETVSQLGPAGTVSGCAPVVSAHEVKTERETGTNIPES